MPAYLEVWRPEGPLLVPLEGDRCSIGKDLSNEVAIGSDGLISRLHAVLERYSGGWCVRDLGSRNGTFVNGERVLSEQVLRDGDEMRIGRTRVVFKGERRPDVEPTETDVAAPELTRRERDVLIALCRPVLTGDTFTQPATIKEVAAALVVTEDAVKQHLVRLYDKFAIHDGGARRIRLANEAIRRGAIGFGDLR